jgi:hypothetical protein
LAELLSPTVPRSSVAEPGHSAGYKKIDTAL